MPQGKIGNSNSSRHSGTIGAPTAALVLTITLLLVLTIVSGLLVWQIYRDTISAAEARAESASQTVAAHIRWIGEAAFQALRRVDDTLGARPDVFVASTVGDLDAAVAALPGEILVWVFDADGDSILTNDALSEQTNVSDRRYFRALRDGDEWHISPLIVGRLSGRKVFAIGRRIERNGEFLGAATIIVPAELLSEFWTTLELGPDSSVGLIREDGWLVARHPIPEDTLDLSKHVLFTRYLPQEAAGSYHSGRSPADGIRRIVGYHTVSGLPLIAVVGVSRDTVMGRFWPWVGAAAMMAVPIAAALLAVSFWVVTLLRRDERQRFELAQALEQNRMLLREIHHRVKNNLQTVAALIQMQPVAPEIKEEMTGRIGAMTAVHEHIYMSDQFGSLDLAAYIRKLVDSLRHSNGSGIDVECDLAEIEVESDRALPVGLIVSEVAGNAFKHAFPGGRKGTIRIILERSADDSARLEVKDDGTGFDGDPAVPGMGTRLIQGLSRQIGADYAFHRDGGTAFTLSFPLVRRQPVPLEVRP